MADLKARSPPNLDDENVRRAIVAAGLATPDDTVLPLPENMSVNPKSIAEFEAAHPAERLALRTPMTWGDNVAPEATIALVEHEWAMLRVLERFGFRWAQKPLRCMPTYNTPIQSPFLVVSWMEGTPLQWSDQAPSRRVRDNILKQLAEIQVSLLRCTMMPASTKANETWEQFFGQHVLHTRTRIAQREISELTPEDCDDQEKLLLEFLGGEDLQRTAVAMEHAQVIPKNILVDGDNNILCLMDWIFARKSPVCCAAGLPYFLWGPLKSPAAQQDFRTYTSAMSHHDSHEASLCLRYQTGDYIELRHRVLESFFDKQVHIDLAAKQWQISPEDEPLRADGFDCDFCKVYKNTT